MTLAQRVTALAQALGADIKALSAAVSGPNPPLWVSGAAQQPAGQWVTSPADKEIYQRIAATNSSTTDPANDVTNYVARSYIRTVALPPLAYVGSFSTGYFQTTVNPATVPIGSRTSVLSITGRGWLGSLQFQKGSGGNLRLEIFCDGRSVYDQTRDMLVAGYSFIAFGTLNEQASSGYLGEMLAQSPNPLQFRRSLQVFVTPSSFATSSAKLLYVAGSEA